MATNGIKKRPRRQIPNLCRICLTGSSSMSDLLEFLNNDEDITILKAAEKVMCCQIKISEKTPNHICSMCLSLLRISYSLKKQFEETQRKLLDILPEVPTEEFICNSEFNGTHALQKTRSEVEIIVGRENYSLGDIFIVEEEDNIPRYTYFLENLGEQVTVECLQNESSDKIVQYSDRVYSSDEKILSNDKNERKLCKTYSNAKNGTLNDSKENESIVIQTASDGEVQSSHWEHEYAQNSSKNIVRTYDVKKRGGRKSKYPKSIMNKINSLIIEGNVQNFEAYNKNNGDETENDSLDEHTEIIREEIPQNSKKKRRGINVELQEIEKYIIFGTGENTALDVQKNETNTSTVSNANIDNAIQIDVLSLESMEDPTTMEPATALMADELILEAFNTKNVCQQCSMTFATRVSLKRHLHAVHKQKNVLIRNPRRKKLSRSFEMRRKIAEARRKLNNNPMLCQICGYVSKSAGGARYHSLTHGEKMYRCDICTKKFYTPSHLKNHCEYKHEKERPKHLCPLCGEYRNSATALSYHLKLHTNEEKKFSCKLCGIKFVVNSALINHMRRHNGDRRFPCEICDKSFFSTNELKKHFMIHTGERPFKCKYCEKRFVTPFNQKIHMMTHDGPYLCEYCSKGFMDTEMLNIHQKNKHQISVTS